MYHGPNIGQGITVHLNSNSIKVSSKESNYPHKESTGEVVIGKLYVDEASYYGNVVADELTFWNRQFSEAEVEVLRNQYEMWPICSSRTMNDSMIMDMHM